jgi:isopentenyl-diphosphate Delta-isomerase
MTDRVAAGTHSDETPDEWVILVSEAGASIGSARKRDVHHTATPLHLAFSCYVFDPDRRLLVTQRALTKHTFPGVWTNTVCGHPAPGEPIEDAVIRRVRQELGIQVGELRLILPDFRYRAVMDNGVTENELCPVFLAVATDQPHVDPAEVAAAEWTGWSAFASDVLDGRRTVSTWCHDQVRLLVTLGPDPLSWPRRSATDLPDAAVTLGTD